MPNMKFKRTMPRQNSAYLKGLRNQISAALMNVLKYGEKIPQTPEGAAMIADIINKAVPQPCHTFRVECGPPLTDEERRQRKSVSMHVVMERIK